MINKERENLKTLLKKKGIDISRIDFDDLKDENLDEFISNYGDWNIGDKVILKEDLSAKVRFVLRRLDNKEWEIERFVFFDVVKLKDYDQSVSVNWFKKYNKEDSMQLNIINKPLKEIPLIEMIKICDFNLVPFIDKARETKALIMHRGWRIWSVDGKEVYIYSHEGDRYLLLDS